MSTEALPPRCLPPRHLPIRRRTRTIRRRIFFIALAAVAAVLLAVGGLVAFTAAKVNGNITRSNALAAAPAVPKLTQDTNILVMGLDSRVDEQGNPLSPALYNALDAGDQSTGGYNANVLMLVHIPADGSKATAISIPRDDYVQIAGIPGESMDGKIKEAYGDGLAAAQQQLLAAGKPNNQATYQQAREAGRAAEIATVSAFLGSVHIDHFVEVTMAGFYQVAQDVAPISVCVLQATQDTYSGANFTAGVQQIDAEQAMAYVRQRRDTSNPDYAFSDLDRERRQQAFIVDVIHQLKQLGTLANIPKMETILNDASSNIVVDSSFNPLEMLQQATAVTSGSISFTTLPITGFSTAPNGESINTVDVAQVQAAVAALLAPPAAKPAAAKPGTTAGPGLSPSSSPSAAPPGQAPSAKAAAPKVPATTAYSDWTGALQGGSIPCVK